MSKLLKHKKGDVVRIKSKEWWNSMPKNENGYVKITNRRFISDRNFTDEMYHFCGNIAIIRLVRGDYYKLDIDDQYFYWDDDMLEDIIYPIKKHAIQRRKYSKIGQFIY